MQTQFENYNFPDAKGHFGPYGGVFVAETLQAALLVLNREYEKAKADPAFVAEIQIKSILRFNPRANDVCLFADLIGCFAEDALASAEQRFVPTDERGVDRTFITNLISYAKSLDERSSQFLPVGRVQPLMYRFIAITLITLLICFCGKQIEPEFERRID